MKLIEDLKAFLRRPNPQIIGSGAQNIRPVFSFQGQPVVPALTDPDFKKKAHTVSDMRGVLEHGQVNRNINSLSQIAFSGWDFKVVPPEGYDAKKNSDVVRGVKDALYEFNKIWRIEEHLREGFPEVLAYRYSFFELAMGQIGKWTIPTYFQHLQAYSFARAPTQFPSDVDEGYVRDALLKGVVYEGVDRKPRLFQAQAGMTKEPVEIPAENVFMLTDPSFRIPDGASYLSGLVGTVLSHNNARQATNQVVARAGAPNAEYHVKRPVEDEIGYAEPIAAASGESADMGSSYSPWWNYGVNLARRQSKDNRVVVPEDIDIIWPDLKIALNPLEPDHYFVQEIIDHLVPVDVLKQVGLFGNAKDMLDYLQMIMGGYREMVGFPFMDLMTWVLNLNGYEGWWVEPVWVGLKPSDVQADKTHSLEALKAGGITIRRFYKETGRDPLDEETGERAELLQEQAIRFKLPAPSGEPGTTPAGTGLQAMSEQTDIDMLTMLLEAKKGGMMNVLKDMGYFDFKAKAEEQN